ncbi:D-alanyl-D-alanine carboxypeptidase DacD [anaerobic digester metagenome]
MLLAFLFLLQPFSARTAYGLDQIPAVPSVTSNSVFVMDARTGTELYAKQPEERISTDAMLPMLIAMVVLDEKNPDDFVLVSQEAQQMSTKITGPSGAAGLKSGERLSVRQLLSSILLANSQDAAVALSSIFENDGQFIEAIRQKITDLSLSDTTVTTYLTASVTTDYTTTRDLGKVMRASLAYPLLTQLNRQTTYSFVPSNMVPEPRTIQNTNQQFNPDSEFHLPQLVAGFAKEGTFDQPLDNSYVGTVQTEQGQFIVALGHSQTSEAGYVNSKTLFDWCFQNFQAVQLIKKDSIISNLPLSDGNILDLKAEADVYHLIPNGTVTPEFSLNFIPAEYQDENIKENQLMGSAEVVVYNKVIGSVNLLSNRSVNPDETTDSLPQESLLDQILRWILQIGVVLFFLIILVLTIRTFNLMRRSRKKQAQLRTARKLLEEEQLIRDEKRKKLAEERKRQGVINRSNF